MRRGEARGRHCGEGKSRRGRKWMSARSGRTKRSGPGAGGRQGGERGDRPSRPRSRLQLALRWDGSPRCSEGRHLLLCDDSAPFSRRARTTGCCRSRRRRCRSCSCFSFFCMTVAFSIWADPSFSCSRWETCLSVWATGLLNWPPPHQLLGFSAGLPSSWPCQDGLEKHIKELQKWPRNSSQELQYTFLFGRY